MNKTEITNKEEYGELEKELSLLRNFVIPDVGVARDSYFSITKSLAHRFTKTERYDWSYIAYTARFASIALVAIAIVVLVGVGNVADPLLDTSDGIAIESTESELAMIDDMDNIMLDMDAEMAEMDIASPEI